MNERNTHYSHYEALYDDSDDDDEGDSNNDYIDDNGIDYGLAMKRVIHCNVGKTIQLELQFMSNHLNANKAKLFHISSKTMRDIFKGRSDFM